MITDPKKWLETLPNKGGALSKNTDGQISGDKFIDSLPKKKTDNRTKIYSLVVFIFVLGLISVSLIKNKTRILQKEINNLQTKVNSLKLELHQSELDYQFLSSPKNLSILAEKYLDYNFITYKKSQINKLEDERKFYAKLELKKKETNSNKKMKTIKKKVKENISRKIENKKMQLKKLEELYSKPEKIPEKMKLQVKKKIKKTKEEISNLYSNPDDVIRSTKTQKWIGIQIVKAFLGLPMVPGK